MMHETPSPSRKNTWAKRRTPSSILSSKKKAAPPTPPLCPSSCPPSTGMSFASTISNGSNDNNGSSWSANKPKSKQQQQPLPIQVPHLVPKIMAVLLILLLINAIFLINVIPSESRFNPRMTLYKHPSDSAQEADAKLRNTELSEQPNTSNQNVQLSADEIAARKEEIAKLFPAKSADELYVERLQEMERIIPLSTGISSTEKVKSCRFLDCQEGPKWVFYNPFSKARLLCGTTLDPNRTLVMDKSDPCFTHNDTISTLLPALPTRHNQHNSTLNIPPIRLNIKGVKPSKSFWLPFKRCDVKCSHLNNNLQHMAITRTIQDTDWEIVTSMEGPLYYHSVNMIEGRSDNNDARPDNLFYATTSLDSEIPMAYFSWLEYAPDGIDSVASANNFDEVEKAAVYMARNCESKNQREEIVQQLIKLSNMANKNATSKVLRVDSISNCLHNRDPPAGLTKSDDKNDILQHYMFYLAFENQCVEDYITEKLWGSLFQSGAIPVYFGAPNIDEHIPPHSTINVRDFASTQALWDHMVQVSNDRFLYNSYHVWRHQPLPEGFVRKYNFTHTHSLCRMCRWAFAKQYGYGWNHEQQSIEEDLVLSKRKICWDKTSGLLTRPFRETWLSAAFQDIEPDRNHTMCYNNPSACILKEEEDATTTTTEVCDDAGTGTPRSMTFDNGAVRRTVWSHDGVLDVRLEPTTDQRQSMVLKLQASFLTDIEEHLNWNMINHRQFWVQGKTFRMTIVTNQDIGLANPTKGIIQMFVSLSETVGGGTGQVFAENAFRMRVILEHLDEMTQHVNTKNQQQMSYYGNLMVEDFLNPIEKFLLLNGTTTEGSGSEKEEDKGLLAWFLN